MSTTSTGTRARTHLWAGSENDHLDGGLGKDMLDGGAHTDFEHNPDPQDSVFRVEY